MTAAFDFDDEGKSVTFKGSGLHLLLGLIQRAKFGERYDSELLINDWLADLSMRLVRALGLQDRMGASAVGSHASSSLEDGLILAIRDAIIANGASIGWWSWSVEARRHYLRKVVAAPRALGDAHIERIEDAIEGWLFRAREVIAAADAG